jgi:hypothetical protein
MVFGGVVNEQSQYTLEVLNTYGTTHGAPSDAVIISDCGQL